MKNSLKTITEKFKSEDMAYMVLRKQEADNPKTCDNRRNFLKKIALGGFLLVSFMCYSFEDNMTETTSKVSKASAPSELKITDMRYFLTNVMEETAIIRINTKQDIHGLGEVRDAAGLLDIEGFNGWHKGAAPSYLQEEMLTGINIPIRIVRATVLLGGLVLANRHETVFIPTYLTSELVLSSKIVGLRDLFGFQRLREKNIRQAKLILDGPMK